MPCVDKAPKYSPWKRAQVGMIHLYNPQLSAELSLSRDKTRDVFSISILSLSQGLASKQGKENLRVRCYSL